MLSRNEFATVVELAPLTAVDLIVKHPDSDRFLFGRRRNPPAKGFLFVPGGRIRKNERFEVAVKRIANSELGFEISLADVTFLGMYEHFYTEGPFEEIEKGTHYCVCALQLCSPSLGALQHCSQHSELVWVEQQDIEASAEIHRYAKAYFLKDAVNKWF